MSTEQAVLDERAQDFARASAVMTMRNARLRQPCAWCGRELVGIKHQVIGVLHFCDNANECAAQYAMHIPGDTDYAI